VALIEERYSEILFTLRDTLPSWIVVRVGLGPRLGICDGFVVVDHALADYVWCKMEVLSQRKWKEVRLFVGGVGHLLLWRLHWTILHKLVTGVLEATDFEDKVPNLANLRRAGGVVSHFWEMMICNSLMRISVV